MGVIKFCRGNTGIQLRSDGQTILIITAALLVCLTGLAGCGSSGNAEFNAGVNAGNGNPGSGSSPGSDSSPGSGGPSGCFSTAFMRPAHRSHPANQPDLASARLASFEAPLPIIPRPESNFDEVRPAGEDLQRQTDWAHNGLDYEQSHPVEMPASLPATQENLQIEANAVIRTEETTLITDDLNALNSGDSGYAAEICRAIAGLDRYISNLNDLNQVVTYLQQLASYDNSQAPNDLAGVAQDTFNKFEQVFGPCVADLNSTQWIIQFFQSLFCGGQLSRRRLSVMRSSAAASC